MILCDILIISNDTDDIEILTEALNNSGVESVHYVYSSKKAFQYLKEVYPESLPKIIVTDFLLTGTTAIEFLTDFKAMDNYKTVKAVVLSSVNSTMQIEKLREVGDFEYFVKPTCFREYEKVARIIIDKIAV